MKLKAILNIKNSNLNVTVSPYLRFLLYFRDSRKNRENALRIQIEIWDLKSNHEESDGVLPSYVMVSGVP